MPVIYHLNKKQVQRLLKRINQQEIYVECIKSYLNKQSIKDHTPLMPQSVYVADTEGGRETSYLVRYENTIDDTRPIFGNIVFYYGDKTYAQLPADKKLTDAQVDEIVL